MNHVKGWRRYYNRGEKARKGAWWTADAKQVLMQTILSSKEFFHKYRKTKLISTERKILFSMH